MPGRSWPIILSGVVGLMLGSAGTLLLTRDAQGPRNLPALSAQPGTAAQSRSPATAPAPEAPELAAARQALATRLRNPDTLQFQDVRVWQYGPADERAVCGTMLTAEIAGGTARFVVRVLYPRGRPEAGGRPAQTVVEDAPWLVRPSPEAARRFCRDLEPDPPPQASRPAEATAVEAAAPPPPPAAAEGQRGGRVITQSPANLRAAPSGEVLAAVPRGRTLMVFDRAPGGWVQVGDSAPEGWIHASLLMDLAGSN